MAINKFFTDFRQEQKYCSKKKKRRLQRSLKK